MSDDRGRAMQGSRGSAIQDRIAEVVSRPLPAGAADLLARLAPAKRADQTIYLSTPITTGPGLLDWLAKHPHLAKASGGSEVDVVRDEVVRANVARLAPLRERVRVRHPGAHLIDPTQLEVRDWRQPDYHRFWVEVIRKFVDQIVFADGWELSTGCALEYAAGLELDLPLLDAAGTEIPPTAAAVVLLNASESLTRASRDGLIARHAAKRAERASTTTLKDSQLVALAASYNVASFVSFSSGEPLVRHGILAKSQFRRAFGVEGAIEQVLASSRSGLVNVRTFRPGTPKGNPFFYGLDNVDEAVARVRLAAADGYYSIVNETIDIHDGGVSGVTLGGIVEFAPDDTPRAVELGDTARLPLKLAEHVLRNVYGAIELPASPTQRVEFSVHPTRTGHRREHVVVWEAEEVPEVPLDVDVRWPNRFSELIGDKTFGLLIADAIGVRVPATTVINRRVAPFRFGRVTGTGEWWMRTAPARQTPGHFTTMRGWTDPFSLLAKEDPDGAVVSVLAQEGVKAHFSGATLPRSGGGHIVEGVVGAGDGFMQGELEGTNLPDSATEMVKRVLDRLEEALGPGVRIEWATDGKHAWVLQLHRVRGGSVTGVFSPGVADVWLPFDPSDGLEALGELVARAQEVQAGIEVTKPIGLTSHVGDLLRKAGVPGRLKVADV